MAVNRRKFMASLGIGIASCTIAKANPRNSDEWMTVRTGRRDEGDIWVYCHIIDNRTGKTYRSGHYVKCDGTIQVGDRLKPAMQMNRTLCVLASDDPFIVANRDEWTKPKDGSVAHGNV